MVIDEGPQVSERTNEASIRLVGVVYNALMEIFAEVSTEVVGFDGTSGIVGIDVYTAEVLVDLVDRDEAEGRKLSHTYSWTKLNAMKVGLR